MKHKGIFDDLAGSKSQASVAGRRWLIFVSIFLAVLLLFLAVRDLDWTIFWDSLKNTRFSLLPMLLLWSSAGFVMRAFRLRILLAADEPVSIQVVFWANMAGYLGNNLLPARAGELVRAAYLGARLNVGSAYALAVGLVERLMDLLTLIVLGSIALASSRITSAVFQNALRSVAFLGLFGLGMMFMLPRFENVIGDLILSLPRLQTTYKLRLKFYLQQFLLGLRALYFLKRTAQFLGYSMLIWLIDGFGSVLLGYVLHIRVNLQVALVLLAALGLSSAIPSTPGYIGVYQFVAVTTLAPFGISKADALAYILVSQILGYIVIGFWGLLGLWQFNRTAAA